MHPTSSVPRRRSSWSGWSALVLTAAGCFGAEQPSARGKFSAERGYNGDLTLLASGSGQSVAAAETAARAAFLQLIQRPKVELAPEQKDLGEEDGLKRTYFSYQTQAGQRVPGLWYQSTSAQGPRPVVVILHGTGGNKEGMKDLLSSYARAGFAAVAIDGRYHGERTATGKGTGEYQDAILRAWRTPGREHPFFYDPVWDVMRLVDYLETRPDVDAKRIGLTGISKGGIETYLTAAVDPRIAVAIPFIGVQSFRWALDHDAWQSRISTIQNAVDTAAKESGGAKVDANFVASFYAKVAPGLAGQFDGPGMVGMIAPRPLFIINGDSDARTPMGGLQQCVEWAQVRYKGVGATDRIKFLAQKDTGHKVTPEAHALALEWFKQWLKP